MPNVQWRTPDAGQRNCPKQVEFLDKNKFVKISASIGFIKNKFVAMYGHMNIKKKLSMHLPAFITLITIITITTSITLTEFN